VHANYLIKVSSVSKSFGKKKVLEDISFSVNPSEIVGLIGPNGSGKTTLLNIIMKMLKADHGDIHTTSEIGMAVSRNGFFGDMTVKRNIEMYTALMQTKNELGPLLEQLEVNYQHLRYSNLSAGMKQKVSLICGLVSKAPLLLLDEPINHLDVDSIFALRKIIEKRKLDGNGIFLTSHILTDVEKVCDRILFLREGKISADFKTQDAVNQYGSLENAYQALSGSKNNS
jgi:ABC-2 type transport system ATP-binding protein